MKNELLLQPVYWASVSGGKDSLYMLKFILENPGRYPLHGVIHYELEIDYPFIKNVIDYMENECKSRGIPFLRLKPKRTWDDLYKKYGFPSRVCRWCNSMYKLDPERSFTEYLKQHNEKPFFYIGYCADETKRFKNNGNIYPLAENGINESEILKWAANIPIFNGYYKIMRRCGCMKCPMQSIKETAYIKLQYPDIYNEMMRQAYETECDVYKKTGKHISVWGGNCKYDTVYRHKRIVEKYESMIIKELGEMENAHDK